jgi:hypothetical protein
MISTIIAMNIKWKCFFWIQSQYKMR